MKQYIWNVLISLDQLANTLLAGDPDETLSSRMGKRVAMKDCPVCNFICRVLDWLDEGHCKNSIEYDEGRKIPKIK